MSKCDSGGGFNFQFEWVRLNKYPAASVNYIYV